jgi:hypothetical protein
VILKIAVNPARDCSRNNLAIYVGQSRRRQG